MGDIDWYFGVNLFKSLVEWLVQLCRRLFVQNILGKRGKHAKSTGPGDGRDCSDIGLNSSLYGS
jgi:hypothetical protein